MDLDELSLYCDGLLDVGRFEDYCPNGLQVEAGSKVTRLITGVTASQALIDAAVELRADALLVHHGFFWKGEPPRLRGMKGRRIATLIRGEISLLAYHLPLDAHPQLGNNAQLAMVCGFTDAAPADAEKGLLWHGAPAGDMSLRDLAARVAKALDRQPITVAAGDHPVRRIAWCTGGAQGYIEQAAELGVDAYLSGEISEQTTHQARELGVHYLAAGHHATERYGVQALGRHLEQRFGIEHRHVDVDNPA